MIRPDEAESSTSQQQQHQQEGEEEEIKTPQQPNKEEHIEYGPYYLDNVRFFPF